jgi:hypothetical protein
MGLADNLASIPGLTSLHLEVLAAHDIRTQTAWQIWLAMSC